MVGEASGDFHRDCTNYNLLLLPTTGRIGNVQFGKLENGRIGLATIDLVTDAARTPEGIGVGASPAQVRSAYPDVTEFRGGLTNGEYAFRSLGAGPAVTNLGVQQGSSCGTF